MLFSVTLYSGLRLQLNGRIAILPCCKVRTSIHLLPDDLLFMLNLVIISLPLFIARIPFIHRLKREEPARNDVFGVIAQIRMEHRIELAHEKQRNHYQAECNDILNEQEQCTGNDGMSSDADRTQRGDGRRIIVAQKRKKRRDQRQPKQENKRQQEIE